MFIGRAARNWCVVGNGLGDELVWRWAGLMRWCDVDVLAPVGTCQVCGSGRRVTEYGEHAERLYSIGPIACMRWNACCQENNHGINRVVALADACKYRFTRQGRTTAPTTLPSGRRSAPRVSNGLRSPSCSLPGAACVTRASGYVAQTGCPAARTLAQRVRAMARRDALFRMSVLSR